MSVAQTRPIDIASSSPATVAQAFIAAYRQADTEALYALSSRAATARYVPVWNSGAMPITDAIRAWVKYPAAFADFDMPITMVVEDVAQRNAVVTTLNKGVHVSDVDGIVAQGRTLACPHLFAIQVDANGLIDHVDVWCDQLTLFQQLGFPADFTAGDAP
jgi:hypothetical protein